MQRSWSNKMRVAGSLAIAALVMSPPFLNPALAQEAEALSPNVAKALSPITDALERERVAQAALPAPTSVREQLERMGRMDQVGRAQIGLINFAALSPEEGGQLRRAIGQALAPVDRKNAEALKLLLKHHTWFPIGEFGADASSSAFHIVQHSGDIALMKQVLPRLEPLARAGQIDSFDFAAMYDRVATKEGRPQRYGTQFRCTAGKLESFPLEDISKVEQWRSELRFDQTYRDSAQIQLGKRCG